jgi:hypothetical protein
MYSFHVWMVYGDSMMVPSGTVPSILLSEEYIPSSAAPPAREIRGLGTEEKNRLCKALFKGTQD